MKAFYVTAVVDSFFTAIASFFMLLIISSYFIPYPFTLVFSGCFAMLLSLLTVKNQIKKGKKKGLDTLLSKEYSDAMTQFNLMPTSELMDLAEKLVKKEGFTSERKKSGIYIKEKNSYLFIKFGFDGVTKTDIVKYFNRITKNDKAIVLSEDFSKEVREFADRFDGKIILLQGRLFFERLKEYDMIPKNKYTILNKKIQKPKIISALNNKKKAKSFLTFGLIFLGFSYFAPIKTYYVVVGALMLILALVIRLFGKAEYENTN